MTLGEGLVCQSDASGSCMRRQGDGRPPFGPRAGVQANQGAERPVGRLQVAGWSRSMRAPKRPHSCHGRSQESVEGAGRWRRHGPRSAAIASAHVEARLLLRLLLLLQGTAHAHICRPARSSSLPNCGPDRERANRPSAASSSSYGTWKGR